MHWPYRACASSMQTHLGHAGKATASDRMLQVRMLHVRRPVVERTHSVFDRQNETSLRTANLEENVVHLTQNCLQKQVLFGIETGTVSINLRNRQSD